jgi:hypothetical protein
MALTEARTVLTIVARETCFSASGGNSASAVQIMAPAVESHTDGQQRLEQAYEDKHSTTKTGWGKFENTLQPAVLHQ